MDRAKPLLLADRMLGKLARMLRMIGQDVEYARAGDPQEIARRAEREGRVLLTRDRRLAQRSGAAGVLFLDNNYPFHQARQVIRELDLAVDTDFTRCVEDNGRLAPAPPDEVAARVPEHVRQSVARFYQCERCRRVFWDGTHVAAMRDMIKALEDAPLVPGDGLEDRLEEEPAAMLEPLLDLHQALEVLLLRHRLALMEADVGRALRMFRRFSACMRRHVDDEEELVLPLYAGAEPPGGYERGAAPDIFQNEHRKILAHLAELEQSTAALSQSAPDELAARCLMLLDREKVFADLIEHHDLRERAHLYPALERLLADNEKRDLLERMTGIVAEETP